MENEVKRRPMLCCITIFLICSLARLIEYFAIRTDRTIFAENFLHKLFGIIVLAITLHLLHSSWQAVGFKKDGASANIAKGFLLGCLCFTAAYSVECLILYSNNQNISLSLYVSGFSLSGDVVKHTGIISFSLCIIFNIINVWMEEGIFRGLFMRILAEKLSFMNAMLFTAFLFGAWHWVMPFRDYTEGNTSFTVLLVMGIGYVLLAGIMSVKWSFLYKITGTLWMGLGDHLFNNVVVTNLLHVISNHEADNLQIVRIMIGQILSFSVVMAYYRKSMENGTKDKSKYIR